MKGANYVKAIAKDQKELCPGESLVITIEATALKEGTYVWMVEAWGKSKSDKDLFTLVGSQPIIEVLSHPEAEKPGAEEPELPEQEQPEVPEQPEQPEQPTLPPVPPILRLGLPRLLLEKLREKARETANYILSILNETTFVTGVSASEVGEQYDFNGDGVVNLADAYICLFNVGLLPGEEFEPRYKPEVAREILARLEEIYGENLVNFPLIDGRVELLYVLAYKPYV